MNVIISVHDDLTLQSRLALAMYQGCGNQCETTQR